MPSDLEATRIAFTRSGEMTHEVNNCAGNEQLQYSRALPFIKEKSRTTPFFYSMACRLAANKLETPLNINGLESLACSIIVIDEIREQDPDCIDPESCLNLALTQMGFNNYQTEHPLVTQELRAMYDFMGKENEFLAKWQDQPAGNANQRYSEYRAAVNHSIGMRPLYALVAEENAETELFSNQQNQWLLNDLETATRILADVITLGKDQKDPNSLNVVLEFQKANPGIDVRTAQKLLCMEAQKLISPATENRLQGPKFLQFALAFAEVLEDISPLPEQNRKLTAWIKMLGFSIRNALLPVKS